MRSNAKTKKPTHMNSSIQSKNKLQHIFIGYIIALAACNSSNRSYPAQPTNGDLPVSHSNPFVIYPAVGVNKALAFVQFDSILIDSLPKDTGIWGFQTTSKTYDDSLRVIESSYGDRTVTRFIDLNGTLDDGFDGTYSVTSDWYEVPAKRLKCDQFIRVVVDSFEFSFCREAIRAAVDSILGELGPWIGNPTDPWDSLNLHNVELARLKIRINS